jgi:hypothetical protein
LGELFAIKALVDNSFDRIKNLNDKARNEPFADLFCEKEGKKYVISVKARNKFQLDGKLNSRYNLGKNAQSLAESVEKKYNAIAYWMAIQFDTKSISIFFGSLSELGKANAIPIAKCMDKLIGVTLVENKRHYFDFDFYSNKNSIIR